MKDQTIDVGTVTALARTLVCNAWEHGQQSDDCDSHGQHQSASMCRVQERARLQDVRSMLLHLLGWSSEQAAAFIDGYYAQYDAQAVEVA